ncbi:MAG: hypothetical protein ABFD08_07020 [Syntrophomonas sp.]
MELMFNEHSINGAALDIESAKACMFIFAKTVHTASKYGIDAIVRINHNFWNEHLTPGYSLLKWKADHTVDKELIRRIKSYTVGAPFIEDILSRCEDNGSKLAEFKCHGKICIGLGAAFMTNSPAVSMNNKEWSKDPLDVSCSYLSDEGDAISAEKVCNFCTPVQVGLRQTWIHEHLENELTSGERILLRSNAILNHIQFTTNSRKQLSELTGNEKVFLFVVKHLIALNAQCVNWHEGNFVNGYKFPCTEESKPTMAKYGDYRKFILDDGREVSFTWHSKINVDKWRIYFLHNASTNMIIIPYIGKHLPTVENPT